MAVSRASETPMKQVRQGLTRRLAHTNDLMMAVLDFNDGPWQEPEPLHHHVHEQVSYLVDGEVLFFCEGEPAERLKAGDMFLVPSGKKHGIQLLTATARLVDCFNPIRKDFL